MSRAAFRNIQEARAHQAYKAERIRPEEVHHEDALCLECGCVETSAEVFDGEFTTPCPREDCRSESRCRA